MEDFVAVALVFVALPALAAGAKPPPGSVMVAPNGQVAIAAAPCAELAAGAAYVPGIDSQGNDVVPADLPSTPGAANPADITLKLDARLAAQFGANVGGGSGARMMLGTITVRDGRAYLNGKPLDANANEAMIAACRAAQK